MTGVLPVGHTEVVSDEREKDMKTSTLTRASLTLAALALLATTTSADAEDPKPLRALMISGGCCHDYKGQNNVLSDGISKRARVVWTIVQGGKARGDKISLYEKKDWAKDFDVIVHNECYGGVTDVKFVENIAKAHFDGKPAVMIHCSMHSYRNAKTDEWRKCLGVTSKRHERHRPYTVKVLEKKHPIMIGFHDGWIPPNGELYMIEKHWPKCTPLAKAYGKDTKKDHTVIWTNQYGKGRVFGTTIGHHTATQKEEQYLDLVTRGLLWACDQLEKDGTPKPGYEADDSEPKEKSAAKTVPEKSGDAKKKES